MRSALIPSSVFAPALVQLSFCQQASYCTSDDGTGNMPREPDSAEAQIGADCWVCPGETMSCSDGSVGTPTGVNQWDQDHTCTAAEYTCGGGGWTTAAPPTPLAATAAPAAPHTCGNAFAGGFQCMAADLPNPDPTKTAYPCVEAACTHTECCQPACTSGDGTGNMPRDPESAEAQRGADCWVCPGEAMSCSDGFVGTPTGVDQWDQYHTCTAAEYSCGGGGGTTAALAALLAATAAPAAPHTCGSAFAGGFQCMAADLLNPDPTKTAYPCAGAACTPTECCQAAHDESDESDKPNIALVVIAAAVVVTVIIVVAAVGCCLCGMCKTDGARAKQQVISPAAGPPQQVVPVVEQVVPVDRPLPSFDAAPERMVKCPRSWQNQDNNVDFKDIQFVPDLMPKIQQLLNYTYKQVTSRDRKGGTMPEALKVIMVNRIENRDLWQAYAQEKRSLAQKRPHRCTPLSKLRGGGALTHGKGMEEITGELDARVNEVLLWHGTSPNGAAGIAKGGFRLDFSGSATGSMFGTGVYLAECSSKSDEYSKDDTDGIYKGQYCLLLCRVSLGEILTMTAGGDEVHGIVKAAVDSGAYESVLGDREASVGTYREFIALKEKHVYPEYVVLYQRILQGAAPEESRFLPGVVSPSGPGEADSGPFAETNYCA